MEALGYGIVAAMGDDQIHPWQDRRLRQELGAPHVVGQSDEFMLWPFADNHSMPAPGQHLGEVIHQLDIRRSQAP